MSMGIKFIFLIGTAALLLTTSTFSNLACAEEIMAPKMENDWKPAKELVEKLVQDLKDKNSATFVLLRKQCELLNEQGFAKLESFLFTQEGYNTFVSKGEVQEFTPTLKNLKEGQYRYRELFTRSSPDVPVNSQGAYSDQVTVVWKILVEREKDTNDFVFLLLGSTVDLNSGWPSIPTILGTSSNGG